MSPDQMQELASLFAKHGLPPMWDQWALLIAVQFLVLVLSAYAGAHFGKRGEISAIRAKLNEVLTHQQALTEITATVNSNISRRDWLDQRKWDVRQHFYWELLRTVHLLAHAYMLAAELRANAESEKDPAKATAWAKQSSSSLAQAEELSAKLRELTPMAGVIVSEAVEKAITEHINASANARDKDASSWLRHQSVVAVNLYLQCKEAARIDLQLSEHSVPHQQDIARD